MPRPADEIFTLYGRVILGLIAAAGLLVVYVWLSRRRLGTGYGVLWTGVFSALLAVATFPVLALWVGRLAGSRDPEGGLRLGAFVVAFVMLLYMSLKTSQLQRRIEDLVQALALRDANPPPAGPSEPKTVTSSKPESPGA